MFKDVKKGLFPIKVYLNVICKCILIINRLIKYNNIDECHLKGVFARMEAGKA